MKKKGFIALALCLVLSFTTAAAYASGVNYVVNGHKGQSIGYKNKVKPKKEKPKKEKPKNVAVIGITLNKTKTTIAAGSWERLVATVQPAGAKYAKVFWYSENPLAAWVNPSGKVTGVIPSTIPVRIWAVAFNSKDFKKAYCDVTVTGQTTATEVRVTSVTIDETTTVKDGATKRLSAQVLPENATNKNVTWSTSDSDIVSVDRYGNITGVDEGRATITVTTADGGKTDSCRVTVIPADEWVRVTGVSLNLVETKLPVGFTDQLRYLLEPSDASDQTVVWSSSNSDVASVDDDGTITAKRRGTADITVTTVDRSRTYTCSVTVVAAPVLPSRGILLNKVASTMVEGEIDYPEVVFYGVDDDDYSLTWSSDDTDVATVNQNGRVTAEEPGTAIITVETSNGWEASYTVKVISD